MKYGASERKKIREISFKMFLDKLRGKKIIILDVEELSFIPYILPIYQALQTRTNSVSYYIGTHYIGNKELEVFEIPLKKQFSVNLSREFSGADIFLSPHIYGVGSPSSVRIHINHNQPVKYEAYQKTDFVNFEVHFLTSPLHREQTENTIRNYNLEDRNIKLYETGYAKSDKLLSGEYDRDKIVIELGLDPSLKTILYSPSWDEGLSLRSFGEKVIENILDVENVNVIVKLHPISYCPADGPNYEFYTGGTDWKQKLSKFETVKNFRHIPSTNIDPILAAADVMVTDVSSVALEFIMLDKPVIYIDCPDFFEKTLKKTYKNFGNTTPDFVRNDPKANAGRHVGRVVYDIKDLKTEIVRALNDPGELSDKRKKFAEQLSYNPGHAAEAAAGTILEILKS